MVTLACCQTCLEHGTSEIDYFRDGQGNPSIKTSDINVKSNLTLATDLSFPIYGFDGQEWYSKYYGYVPIVPIVGTVFFGKKPDYSLTQGKALLQSVLPVIPFLVITVLFAYTAGVIIWALVSTLITSIFASCLILIITNYDVKYIHWHKDLYSVTLDQYRMILTGAEEQLRTGRTISKVSLV